MEKYNKKYYELICGMPNNAVNYFDYVGNPIAVDFFKHISDIGMKDSSFLN